MPEPESVRRCSGPEREKLRAAEFETLLSKQLCCGFCLGFCLGVGFFSPASLETALFLSSSVSGSCSEDANSSIFFTFLTKQHASHPPVTYASLHVFPSSRC